MSSTDRTSIDELRAELESMKDAARALARAAEVIESKLNQVAEPAPEWVKLKRAAEIFGWHRDTMADRARRHGLGHQEGRRGDWLIDVSRVRAWLDHRPFRPIRPADREYSAETDGNTGNVPITDSRRQAANSSADEEPT